MLLLLAVAGVFGYGEADGDAWRAAVEQQRGPVSDWEAHREVWLEEICGDDEESFAWLVTAAVQEGASVEALRTNVSYACPDRLDVLDRVGPAIADVTDACRARPRQRSEDERLLADGLGC